MSEREEGRLSNLDDREKKNATQYPPIKLRFIKVSSKTHQKFRTVACRESVSRCLAFQCHYVICIGP